MSDPTVLIVDDDPIICEGLEGLLMGENYHLVFAPDGNTALTYINTHEPDVILLDVMMPGLNGYQVCQELKESPKHCHIPIILLTALNDRASLLKGFEVGADEFLSKPISGIELRARVRSMLRIKQQYDRIKTMLNVRSNMVRTLTYDIRTPLNIILLQADLLRNNKTLDEKSNNKIQRIIESVRVINSMLESMLQITRANTFQLKSLLSLGRHLNTTEKK